jgi:DNA-binding MarR family transcriptional regulator
MIKPIIHVAVMGSQFQNAVEHLVIRRRVDEIILVYGQEYNDQAENLLSRFVSLCLSVSPVPVVSDDFTNVLSSILKALDHHRLDDYDVEFSVSSCNNIMAIAVSVAAAITQSSILFINSINSRDISEIWPSELVNLTHKKQELLSYLDRQDCSIHQKTISEATGIMQSGISRHLHDLERAGYITRYRDSRNKQVRITELGSTVFHQKQIRKRRVWSSFVFRTPQSYETVGL